MRRLFVLALVVALPLHAFAQEDDLLAPLTDEAPKKTKKVKKPKAEKKQSAKKDKNKGKEQEDDLLESLVASKTELAVKLPSNVKGAKLFVDGKEQSAGAMEVSPGDHTVMVKRIGYADFSKKVTAADGKLTEVNATLEPVAGVLSANVEPDDAEVRVDDKLVGEGDVKDVLLVPGTRTITVHKDGMADEKVQLAVKAGRDYPINVTLKPMATTHTVVAENADRPERTNLVPDESVTQENEVTTTTEEEEVSEDVPVYKRWYVWAGAGAVAAGVVTGIVVANSSGGKTLSESQICGASGCDAVLNGPARGFRF